MDEQRRLTYLARMGIHAWQPREDGAEALAPPLAMPPAVPPAPEPVVAEPPRPRPTPRAPEPPPLPMPPPCAPPPAEVVARATPAPVAARVAEPPDDDLFAPAVATAPGSAAAVAAMDWGQLAGAVRECRGCALHETRQHSVFGSGAHDARLMLIGEAPGADEDRQGEPFVGRAGQLLTRMLEAIGLTRETVFIANVLKCRPPGNRDPRPEEMARCEGYLQRQIALIEPTLILSLGRISAQHLLNTDVSVGRLRGRWFEIGEARIPLRVTYHPAYLLRSPAQKAKAWEDLSAVAQRLREGGGK
ncbi:uracil-DNA glycosylase [Marichromatium bheemlicum]|uniref:Type-4 uracil-DNA glycosylase n=1 Tax=Marichromatium bheemlicum TaxID=365339 RepID=A0ABX1I8V5_9GAMM|nr:uracil-DNA glycosylase [Marichromatium bheemlicum]NKN33988.1 uracil-DNA glycosylase [Marichromatium bheemlicum]